MCVFCDQAGTYTMRSMEKTTNAQIEIDIWHSDIVVSPSQKMAPTRLLSFDIECKSRGHFPSPLADPILMISNILEDTDDQGKIHKRGFSFALGKYNPVKDTPEGMAWIVYECKTEEQLLIQWRDFVVTTDPDFMLGHNVHNFDFPYLLDRANKLKVRGAARLRCPARCHFCVRRGHDSFFLWCCACVGQGLRL